MKAAVFVAKNQPFELCDYPLNEPPAGMTAVTLERSGICGTDVHIWEGAIGFAGPMIIGHEFIGRVHAIGPTAGTGTAGTGTFSGKESGKGASPLDCLGQPLAVGDRVIVNVIEPCGKCVPCRTGGAASCLNLGASLVYLKAPDQPPHFHGGFAEATVVPTRYLHKLPPDIPTDVASAFLCAGPTVMCGLRYAGPVEPGQHVVVQGSGPVGLFATLYAASRRAASLTVIGSSSHPLRMELARSLGATHVLDIRSTTPADRAKAVLAATGGAGADIILEGAGRPEAFREGLDLLRNCGRYVLAGQYSDRGEIAIPSHVITFKALRIFGSAQFTVPDRVAYLDFMRTVPDRWPAVRKVVTDCFTVDRANEAIAAVRDGRAVKAVFVPR